MRRAANPASVFAAALLAAACGGVAHAQPDDAPRAPRILPAPEGSPTAAGAENAATPSLAVGPIATTTGTATPPRPPNAARLAPLPEERADGPDEIIVIGKGWRLPDLGSEWRARQREQAMSGRFSATALPLYDPDDPPYRSERSLSTPEERRHGYIELFRLRFGRRSNDE